MKEFTLDSVSSAVAGKTVVEIIRGGFRNTRYNANWYADCIVFDDGTWLALCIDEPSIEYILLEKDE